MTQCMDAHNRSSFRLLLLEERLFVAIHCDRVCNISVAFLWMENNYLEPIIYFVPACAVSGMPAAADVESVGLRRVERHRLIKMDSNI